MAIHSSPFGAVVLSGEDARRFEEQIKAGPDPKTLAAMRRTFARGDELLREFNERGFATLRPSRGADE